MPASLIERLVSRFLINLMRHHHPFLAILALLFCQAACAAAPATQASKAITYTHETRQNPPLHLHILSIDLTNPSVSIVVRPAGSAPKAPALAPGGAPWQTTLMTVRAILRRDDLAAAVNGDFFAPQGSREILGRKVPYFDGNPARVIGPAMSDSKPWSTALNNNWAALVVHGERTITFHQAPRDLPADVTQVVGGSALVLINGRKPASNKDLAPRTAAGIDKDNKRLILLVIDGRRPEYSAGVSLDQLGDEMLRLGCHNAINLDGGGSSTMIYRDPDSNEPKLANRPSDGHDFLIPLSVERPIANVLGIRLIPLKPEKK